MKTELVEITKLTKDPRNARTHDERNIGTIRHSLERFGQQKPIVIGSDDVVVAGNGTLEAAQRLGWTEISVVRTRLTGADARAYAIADNRTAELAAWDNELLALTLEELKGFDFDLDALGFAGDELERIAGAGFHGEPGLTDPDAIPEPPDEAITQRGDLWVLGDHRLLCGDSSSAEDVDRLLDGQPVHLCNTDPPYNVNVEPASAGADTGGQRPGKRPKRPEPSWRSIEAQRAAGAKPRAKTVRPAAKVAAKGRRLVGDFVRPEEFESRLLAWFGNIARVLLPGRAAYLWGGYANIGNYPPALKAAGLYFSQAIIWVKEHPVISRKDFMGNHEWCFYCWREGAAHEFFGPNNATDVWAVKKVNPASMVHLTEKPVELAVRAIQYSSRPGENVLDLFGGSGSTLIGGQQTGRRAFLMELDPLYCDVIVKRYEEFTGQKAQRAGAGTTTSPSPEPHRMTS